MPTWPRSIAFLFRSSDIRGQLNNAAGCIQISLSLSFPGRAQVLMQGSY